MQYTAIDRNAVERVRTHEFLNKDTGRVEFYRFHPTADGQDNPTTVPQAFALLLAKNPDFLVKDDQGHELRIVETIDGAAPVLAADQVIAKLTELTQEALVARVLAAGGKGGKTTARAELIAFLINEASRAGGDPELVVEDVDLDDAA
jgi:hypothetical protein